MDTAQMIGTWTAFKTERNDGSVIHHRFLHPYKIQLKENDDAVWKFLFLRAPFVWKLVNGALTMFSCKPESGAAGLYGRVQGDVFYTETGSSRIWFCRA